MIPKKIHYCWFSNEPFPAEVQCCMESWQIYLKDYELIKWDYESIGEIDNLFLQQALHEKKWAFASDFIRIYAVYHFGGIYLDTDVMLYRDFDSFLNKNCFIGRESSFHMVNSNFINFLTAHCFGAEKENQFLLKCLKYFEDRKFILSNEADMPELLRLNLKILPEIMAINAHSLGWDWSLGKNDEWIHSSVTIYPDFYFDAIKRNKFSVCIHLALGSWRQSKNKIYQYNLRYKIEWRLIAFIDFFLKKFGYQTIRIKKNKNLKISE